MRVIRHELEIDDYQVIDFGHYAEIQSVARSRRSPNGHIDLWALDTEQGVSGSRAVYMVGTGNPMPPQLRNAVPGESPSSHFITFIGTVVCPNNLVFHVFEGPVR